MDAYGLRSYLIEHYEENQLNTLHETLTNGVKCAPDAAKLVLYVCRSLHREFSDKGLTVANKNSCIFLLEQLMKLPIPIAHDAIEEAMHFASVLRERLEPMGANNAVVDHYGYLQFLAAFKLAIFFNPHELLSLFGRFYSGPDVYRHEQQASLCNALGLSWMIPGVIKSLIERKKLLTAIKYTCVFKLEHQFPLVPLLEDHLDSAENRVKEKLKEGTLKAKKQAVDMELCLLHNVIKCIATFELESILSPDSLISRIKELELEKAGRNSTTLKRFNKRSAGASSCSSTASSNQLRKRPRVGNIHQDNTDD